MAIYLGLVCALSTSSAWAEPTEADRATARALAIEGHSALVKKDYATAADRFGRADALVHAPTLVVDWARALKGLGRFVEAHERYELVLREGVDRAAPKSWQRALEDAKKELEALKPRLAWVTVTLQEPADASVKLDGVAVPPAAIGVKRAVDPGFPEINVSASGYEPFKQTLTMGPGEEKSLEIALKRLPEGAPVPIEAADAYRPRKRDDTRHFLTYVALGLGGTGLVTGGVAGGLALRKRSALKSECQGDVCRSSSSKKISTYRTYGTVSGVSLALGVAGLGAGMFLLLTEPKPEDTAHAGFNVRPLLGFATLGAEGTFE